MVTATGSCTILEWYGTPRHINRSYPTFKIEPDANTVVAFTKAIFSVLILIPGAGKSPAHIGTSARFLDVIRCNPTYNNTNYSGTLFHKWSISRNHALFDRTHIAIPTINYLGFWLRYRPQRWIKMCLRCMFILVLWRLKILKTLETKLKVVEKSPKIRFYYTSNLASNNYYTYFKISQLLVRIIILIGWGRL